MSLDQQDAEQPLASQGPRYQQRQYSCGTWGSRTCSCIILAEVRTPARDWPGERMLLSKI